MIATDATTVYDSAVTQVGGRAHRAVPSRDREEAIVLHNHAVDDAGAAQLVVPIACCAGCFAPASKAGRVPTA